MLLFTDNILNKNKLTFLRTLAKKSYIHSVGGRGACRYFWLAERRREAPGLSPISTEKLDFFWGGAGWLSLTRSGRGRPSRTLSPPYQCLYMSLYLRKGNSFSSLLPSAPIQQNGRKSRKLYAVPNKETKPQEKDNQVL